MTAEFLVITLSGLISGFILSVLAIALWARTREGSWMFITLGAVFLFGDFVLGLFDGLGLPVYRFWVAGGVSIIRVVSSMLPVLFLIVGFIIFLIRKRWY